MLVTFRLCQLILELLPQPSNQLLREGTSTSMPMLREMNLKQRNLRLNQQMISSALGPQLLQTIRQLQLHRLEETFKTTCSTYSVQTRHNLPHRKLLNRLTMRLTTFSLWRRTIQPRFSRYPSNNSLPPTISTCLIASTRSSRTGSPASLRFSRMRSRHSKTCRASTHSAPSCHSSSSHSSSINSTSSNRCRVEASSLWACRCTSSSQWAG